MTKRTKKVGVTGKFGARYGVKAKNKYRKIEEKQRKYHKCPKCGHVAVKRESTAIWVCRKCGAKFAGGAYVPQTDAGAEVNKTLRSIITGGDNDLL
ncbi:MAG: 50S ribosomal protein L37Ae [Thermoplasmata archaeon]|nr:MAG: 50S ribosomal protein L37Ae [Thermoplasmata archaeon]MCD6147018.1 50S ribosomal protein L37Ae [Thermoplasmata archaeon]RLF45511.1 MAG: 50S ribosomal protein L37ae [Thermoplasmata archaeon]RLF48096.1 MAG: 50S ribosomal protein L37ae [Thermoplasmata archaeon]RLF63407.1 MAG: 50S ribosomal protein L37ae [Thermoplasmata archaeon]